MRTGRPLRAIARGCLTSLAITLAVGWLADRLMRSQPERRRHGGGASSTGPPREERATDSEPAHPRGAAGGSDDRVEAQPHSALEASAALVTASYRLLSALLQLAATEGRVFRASVPLLCVAGAALAVLGATLWLCLMGLIGWLLTSATGSIGLALGLLVVIHAVLAGGVGLILLLSLRQATFPGTRLELRLLGRTLRYDLARITGVIADPLRPPPASPSNERGTR